MATKKYLDYDGLTQLVTKIKELVGNVGHFTFKATVANVASLPALDDVQEGWVYSVTAKGETTEDFIEGAGKTVAATSEVICVVTTVEEVETKKWALLGPIFDISDRLQFGSDMPADPTDGQTFLYMGETTTTYTPYEGELTAESNPSELGLYEENEGVYTVTSDTKPYCVYTAWYNGSQVYHTKDAVPEVGATVYTISEGVATDSGLTVEAYDAETGITVDGAAYALSPAHDEYVAEKTYYVAGGEGYVKGVIYVYDEAETTWVAQSSGDTFTPISDSEINALFE